MTNEEAIKVLQSLIPVPKRGDTRSTETTEISVALIMAISALSQIESAGTQITNSNLKSERKTNTAEWIIGSYEVKCSHCEYLVWGSGLNAYKEWKFCPNCGKQMKGGE